MNSLQGVSRKKNYFVSINPHDDLDEKKILMEIDYEHPLLMFRPLTRKRNYKP